ncbi:pentapeptide repeat-containing protein [Streptomyces griseocarneus]|nr:pentapeptide repeat-containing protein [Streptomyces griseocarneus]
MFGAHLEGADLEEAYPEGADLPETRLEKARGRTVE